MTSRATPPQLHSSRRGRRVLGLSLLCALALSGWAAAPAQAITESFNFTGAEQEFTVPTGVYRVGVVAIGGAGGAASTAAGGKADQVTGTLNVSPGETLYVEVGGNGSEGGFNGGGLGGANGGAMGGGASDIRTAHLSVPLSTEDTRLLVAAGGGGGGGNGVATAGAAGGDAGSSGTADESCGNEGGGPGTALNAGVGGFGEGGTGEEGDLGLGGDGADTSEEGGGGGGGGGGYFGGGGGGAGFRLCGGGGGGGGSSLVPEGGLSGATAAAHKIEITYNPPPSVTITAPVDESLFAQGQVVNANYSCLPGAGTTLKSCTGPVANGSPISTATPGEHTFIVNAEDNDSGKASESVSYTVIAAPFVGITSPANGATYTQGQVVTASYACAAAGGATLTSCSGPVASGAAIDTATPGKHTFDVDAEDSLGGKTSAEVSYMVAAPSPPNTTLGSHPKKTIKTKKKKVKVKFTFSSDVAGATFKCKLDKGAFAPCASPKTYKAKLGRHTFSVEAVAPGGTDSTPATFRFKVKKKR